MNVYVVQCDSGTIQEEWSRYVVSVHATWQGAVDKIEATGAKLVRNDGGELFPEWVRKMNQYPYREVYEILIEEVRD